MKVLASLSFFSLLILLLICSCSANDEDEESSVRTQYTLTLTAGEGGSVSPQATGTFDEGTVITITATPDDGYRFDRWQGSDNDNGRCGFARHCRTGIKIDSNRDVHAFFRLGEDETRP